MNWVIVGGTRGLGLALARHAARRGHQVTICGKVCPGHLRSLRFCPLDLSEAGSISASLGQEASRRVDVLVFSAATLAGADATMSSLEALRQCMEVNYWSFLEVVRALCQHAKLHRTSKIVAIGSANAFDPNARTAGYDLSKMLLLSAPSIIAPWLPTGATVSVVIPPRMRTRLHSHRLELRDPRSIAASLFHRITSGTCRPCIRLDHTEERRLRHSENPLGHGRLVTRSLREAAYRNSLHQVPESSQEELESFLRQKLTLPSSCEVTAAQGGSGFILRSLLCSLARPGREFVFFAPTFSAVVEWAVDAGYDVRPKLLPPRSRAFVANPSELLSVARTSDPVFYFANPSGIVSWCSTVLLLERFAARMSEKAHFICDEAYAEWLPPSLQTRVSVSGSALVTDERAIFVRTLSKAYGLADLRIGYAYGSARLSHLLKLTIPKYALPDYAAQLATAAFQDRDHLARSRNFVQKERHRIAAAINPRFRLLPGWTPRLLFVSGAPLDKTVDCLRRSGFSPRIQSEFSGCFRVSLGDEVSNDELIDCLRRSASPWPTRRTKGTWRA